MSYGPNRYFIVTMTSGALSSTSADLTRSFKQVYLEIPTMASGSLFILASADGSTYRRVMIDNGNTSTVHATFTVNSSITQRIVPIPPGFRFYKVESTSGATDVVTQFNIICSD